MKTQKYEIIDCIKGFKMLTLRIKGRIFYFEGLLLLFSLTCYDKDFLII